MIDPTPGRMLWYWPTASEKSDSDDSQPRAAVVCHVTCNELVTLSVFSDLGTPYTKTDVVLAHDREAGPGEAEWMPHQLEQARNAN